jgi:SagB-type dehydrogenase family enzyme
VADAAQLLWAAQGVTGFCGLRTAPSAGAVYPLVTYLIAMNVSGLKAGAYIYNPDDHAVTLHKAGGLRAKLLKAVFDQDEVESAPLGILLCALYRRSRRDFGEMGVRLADMEAGHAGQNVLLQAQALLLGAIGMGRMDNGAMRLALDIPEAEEPLYLLLAGAR